MIGLQNKGPEIGFLTVFSGLPKIFQTYMKEECNYGKS